MDTQSQPLTFGSPTAHARVPGEGSTSTRNEEPAPGAPAEQGLKPKPATSFPKGQKHLTARQPCRRLSTLRPWPLKEDLGSNYIDLGQSRTSSPGQVLPN